MSGGLKEVFLNPQSLRERSLNNVNLVYGLHGLKFEPTGKFGYSLSVPNAFSDGEMSLIGTYVLIPKKNEIVWKQALAEEDVKKLLNNLMKRLSGNEKQASLFLSNQAIAARDSAIFVLSKNMKRIEEIRHVRSFGDDFSGRTDETTIKRK